MTQELTAIIEEYKRQRRLSGSIPDRSLLEKAKQLLSERLDREGLTAEGMRFAEVLYRLSGDWGTFVELSSRYLAQPLPIEEEAWARWECTDFLAGQGRNAEAVNSQKGFLAWAHRALPKDRLIWVMYDGTQALSWLQLGLEHEWLQIFDEVMAGVVPSVENRLDRFYYLRTAGYLLINFGSSGGELPGKIRADEASQIAARIRDLATEDPSWDRSFDIQVQSYILELDISRVQHNVEQARRVGIAAMAAVEERLQESPLNGEDAIERLSVLCDNLATSLYRAHQYDQAIALFLHSIELGSPSPYARIRLAASLYATQRDRDKVLKLLTEGARRWYSPEPPWEFIRELPEFLGAANDPDFQIASAIQPGTG